MPLTQEKRLDSNFSNNNDHSYLHKKFKKMATTISVLPPSPSKSEEARYKETSISQASSNTAIPNGSISAAHPEIEKIKGKGSVEVEVADKNVQIIFNESNRLSDVNNVIQMTGQTSVTDEFSNKTEIVENEYIREAGGRYICPYCKLSCAKPSVLQKHIRAHTNERPYPCTTCGFAFKTKSNLYKHRRSRSHALRLQGADITSINDEDLSGESESDTSVAPASDAGSDISIIRIDNSRPHEFSSPELTNDSITCTATSFSVDNKSKTIYKPKFRGTDDKDKLKKSISQNADFLTEHISRIISDNEAIVDVIDTPLQKKYGKIKQIAESKQFLNEVEFKSEISPLNLTKNSNETENSFRKRSHSESFTNIDGQNHPLNPEGSIIKDLLLKTKANGMVPMFNELVDSVGPLFVCPLCQIIYRSAENLEVHRLYYCKNNCATINSSQKDTKVNRPENVFVRSNSINVRLSEKQLSPFSKLDKPTPLKTKPDNLVIVKSEVIDAIAPLPSPGPLLGNTRLVDSRIPSEYKKCEFYKKTLASPKKRMDLVGRPDAHSPRLVENISPRSVDMYSQSKIRCVETTSTNLRTLDEMSQHIRHNSTSLQMFGGEVKIVDHLGSTTTLRIEPSKNQLSPILIHQNISPSKLGNDTEASSVVIRSGLHSGGTMVHNLPTPKEAICTPQPQTPRISSASSISNLPNIRDHITHFQFPPLSAITAFNPLTLPPLSPSASPSGASTILHGGKYIPHVPGIPGPNTPGTFICTPEAQAKKSTSNEASGNSHSGLVTLSAKASHVEKYEIVSTSSRSPLLTSYNDGDKYQKQEQGAEKQHHTIPLIRVKNVDETNLSTKIYSSSQAKSSQTINRKEGLLKRTVEGLPKSSLINENYNIPKKIRDRVTPNCLNKGVEIKSENEIRNFNFENLITKAEIYNNQIPSSSEVQKNTNAQETLLVSTNNEFNNERSETAYFQKTANSKQIEERKSKFLRPSTLPLKPGTFTPKKHHGITPNANTMPLVSPETPRPAKAYGQLYLNGNAYTYLGLKCSTKVFYCTINRPQPTYVPNQHFLSMYSNWQLLSELTPDPLGLSASSAMFLYDSRHRPQNVAVATIKQDLILTHSSQWKKNFKDNKQAIALSDTKRNDENKTQLSDNIITPKKELTGGFESNEEYTYVRGRGRGRYVCSECGIRCKKPSMLKKHIRTHTDVRPYTCIHCNFSFKTKGNLTKHMKSKAHYKKCCELGINPNEGGEMDGGDLLQSGETDDDTDSEGDEGNEGETESSDTEVGKSRLPEHEAAHCLLSLGDSRPSTSATPGLITSARPSTYPYTPTMMENQARQAPQDILPMSRSVSVDSRAETDNEPMDLSKADVKPPTTTVTGIPTARESSVLASLASNTAKLPLQQSHWSNGEPMLHTYLTERALLDTKIKQSQLTTSLSKLRKIELETSVLPECDATTDVIINRKINTNISTVTTSSVTYQVNAFASKTVIVADNDKLVKPLPISKEENCTTTNDIAPVTTENVKRSSNNCNAENAKHVVSEYLKQARINLIKSQDDSLQNESEGLFEDTDDKTKEELPEQDSIKMLDHDQVAAKVVIGAGGIAFKISKSKEFENSYSPGKLMEDGRRVCDICNKTFTKPSQLRLHLNIHYMERPFRCSVCAVSFRTRGHLQKHERSGSHHNKVSMTSTFGAATSVNPRPFRCSDCNIAFRIHGHLAKHLRSKMHVMRLECLYKLPFGTFTEIERAGVSLTDIDTTDCASSLASLQTLARKLHEKDPTKLEYRELNGAMSGHPATSDYSGDELTVPPMEKCDSDIHNVNVENVESQNKETHLNYSATDN